MKKYKDEITQQLYDENYITKEQLKEIMAYRSLNIFSLRNELLFMLYLSVLLFTSGAGILIYKNIDSIGHTVILSLLFLLTTACFYFCFKNANGFSKEETNFKNPIYDYVVLMATLLSCIFVGYLQFQYPFFGNDFGFATLISALIALAAAYYFDNRSALSIGITSLTACIGITITPRALLDNEVYTHPPLCYYGLALGILFIVWAEYSEKINLKKHFILVYITFAQHLISICCITGMFQDYWPVYAISLIGTGYYFYKKSHELYSTSVFVFTLVYGYITFNILIFKILEKIDIDEIYEVLSILFPIYFIASIILFIKMIKQFKKKTDDSDK